MIVELNDMIVENGFRHPSWRYGQNVFNSLYRMSEALGNRIRGDRELDPYHWELNDERFEAFWDWFLRETEND